jgi:hypothetical protein
MVKNITLSADEDLIKKARERAAREKRTLNVAFREWLRRYAGLESSAEDYEELMQRLGYVRPGRRFSREEMHER